MTLRTEKIPSLNKILKEASKTSILDMSEEIIKLIRPTSDTEIQIPLIDMDGLEDGYLGFRYVPKKFKYNRYGKFILDTIDDQENGDLKFDKLVNEFINTKVAPEVDAMRICTYAKVAETNGNKGDAIDLVTQSASVIVEELRKSINHMDEAEVPEEGRILFITPTLLNKLDDMPLTESKAILDDFAQIIEVPQARMNMDVQLTNNGFTVDPAKKINFLIARKDAVIQIPKHVAPEYLSSSRNPDADAHVYTYRTLQLAEVRERKESHIYVSAMA